MIVRIPAKLREPDGQALLANFDNWVVGYDVMNDTYWCRPCVGDWSLSGFQWDWQTVRALEPLYREEAKGSTG